MLTAVVSYSFSPGNSSHMKRFGNIIINKCESNNKKVQTNQTITIVYYLYLN